MPVGFGAPIEDKQTYIVQKVAVLNCKKCSRPYRLSDGFQNRDICPTCQRLVDLGLEEPYAEDTASETAQQE